MEHGHIHFSMEHGRFSNFSMEHGRFSNFLEHGRVSNFSMEHGRFSNFSMKHGRFSNFVEHGPFSNFVGAWSFFEILPINENDQAGVSYGPCNPIKWETEF